MQMQQLTHQNQLLQQLVQTLQKEIQSKNQQQTILIQQLEHLVKDNDNLMSKYSYISAESRKWNQKERYQEKIIKELEETLIKMDRQIEDLKNKLKTQSQTLLNVNSINNMNRPHSSTQLQVLTIDPKRLGESNDFNKVPQVMHIPGQFFNPPSPLKPPKHQQLVEQNVNADQVSKLPGSIQSELKTLKSLSQSLKLQLTRKDLELKSKNQKLTESSKDISSLNDQMQSLKDMIEQMRKQNQELSREIEQKQVQIGQKDEKFFAMYQQMDEQWKQKWTKQIQQKKALQFQNQDFKRQLQLNLNQLKLSKNQIIKLHDQLQLYKKSKNQIQIKQLQNVQQLQKQLTQITQKNSIFVQTISELTIDIKAKQQQITNLQQENEYLIQTQMQYQKEKQKNKNKQPTQSQNELLHKKQQQSVNELNSIKKQNQYLSNELNQLIQKFQQINQVVNSLQVANQQKYLSNNELLSVITLKDKQIQENKEQILQKDVLLTQKHTLLTQKQSLLREKQTLIAQQQKQISQSQLQLTQKDMQILNFKGQINELTKQNTLLQIDVESMQQNSIKQKQSQKEQQGRKGSNYVDLQLFQSLQSEFISVQQELDEIRTSTEQQISNYQKGLKQKDIQITSLNKKYQDLVKLFKQTPNKVESNQTIKSVQLKEIHTHADNQQHYRPIQIKGVPKIEEENLSNNSQQKLIRPIHQIFKSSRQYPKIVQHQPETHKQTIRSPQQSNKINNAQQNLVQNKLLSSRSQDGQQSNQSGEQILFDPNQNIFGSKLISTQRKSDLPVTNTQFTYDSVNKKQRPKTQYIDEDSKNQLSIPREIDINYLRNSIAEFGIDIDFTSIAKHIGLEMSEEKKQNQKQIPQISYHNHQNLSNNNQNTNNKPCQKIKYLKHHNSQSDQKGQYDQILVVKQKNMHSSYGSNQSHSQQRSSNEQNSSSPCGLRVPAIDQQMMRSSYGSNTQFTQIVIYYQDQMNKLKERINTLMGQLRRLQEQKQQSKQYLETQYKQLSQLLRQKQQTINKLNKENQQNALKVEELQTMNDQLRIQLDLKQREDYSNEIYDRVVRIQDPSKYQMVSQSHPTINQGNETNLENNNQHINYLTQSNSQSDNNQVRNLLTPQQQEQTIQIITTLSNQLQELQQSLTQVEDQLRQSRQVNNNLMNDIQKLQDQINSLVESRENIARQSMQMQVRKNQQIQNLNRDIQNLKIQSHLTQDQVRYIQNQNKQLIQQSNTRQSQYQTLLKQVQQKQKLISKLIHEKDQLQAQIQSIKQQSQAIKQQSQSMKQQYEIIKKQNVQSSYEYIQIIQNCNKNQENFNKSIQQKDTHIKKLQKSLKQTKQQSFKLMNQNQTLAKQFNSVMKMTKQLQILSKKCIELQSQNKTLQQAIAGKMSSANTVGHNSGNQSPVLFMVQQRTSDLLLQNSIPISQQNFTINNISNIHTMVEQYGDDSFIIQQKEKQIHQKDKQIHQKDIEINQKSIQIQEKQKQIQQKQNHILQQHQIIQKLKLQGQSLNNQNNNKIQLIEQLQDRLATIQNSFNSEIMYLKKTNAQQNSQLLKLKRQLFSYQKQSGDIQKFIQDNFMTQNNNNTKEQQFNPTMMMNKDRQVSRKTEDIYKREMERNNSFNLESNHSHQISSYSGKNKGNITHYYPLGYQQNGQYLQGRQMSSTFNMGELFMGKKTKPRNLNNTQNYSSLAQLFRGGNNGVNTSSYTSAYNGSSKSRQNQYNSRHNQMSMHAQNNQPQKTYTKFFSQFDRFQQKKRNSNKQPEPSYGAIDSNSSNNHSKKLSDYRDRERKQ